MLRLTLYAMMSVGISVAASEARADFLFNADDLRAVASEVATGSCDETCQVGDWRLEVISAPQDLPVSLTSSYRIFWVASMSLGCGSRGCIEAYLVEQGTRLFVYDESYALSSVRPLRSSELIAWSVGARDRWTDIPFLRAATDGSGRDAWSLREAYPSVHSELLAIPTAETAATSIAVEALELVVRLAQSPEGNRLLLEPLRANGSALLDFALANPGAALSHAALEVGSEVAEGAVVSVAAAVIVDSMFKLPGFDRISPAWQQSLRPVLHIAVVETLTLMRAGTGDPTALVGPLVKRAVDVYRIAWASRATARAQDDALTAMAISIESAVQFVTLVPGPRSSTLASETMQAASSNVRSIVGRDDETAVAKIVNLTFVALMSQARGDDDRARNFVRQILEKGRTSGNITPFSAVLRPVDWLTAVARQGFRDSPEQAAIIMINATRLRELFEEPSPTSSDAPSMTNAPPSLPQTDSSDAVIIPVVGFTGEFSRGFYDPRYPSDYDPPAQHLGVDLPASLGTVVVSPVPGEVAHNGTRTPDPFNKYLVIRDSISGYEHVLGHIESSLETGTTVRSGEPVGTIVRAGTGPHLHWGVNRRGVLAAMDVPSGWGFGRAPLSSTAKDASARGWVDPATIVAAPAVRPVEPDAAAALVAGPPGVEGRPAATSAPDASTWYAQIVPGGRVTGYTHGQFPSEGQRTHPGVDIGGGCGLPVLAAETGVVVKTVSPSDQDFRAVGNAIVLRHPDGSARPVFTAYFHLADPPALAVQAPVERGARLGATGETGAAQGCHLHFEVRHFEGIRGLYHPEWRNIYAVGDWRQQAEFLGDWSEPQAWMETRDDWMAQHLDAETPSATTIGVVPVPEGPNPNYDETTGDFVILAGVPRPMPATVPAPVIPSLQEQRYRISESSWLRGSSGVPGAVFQECADCPEMVVVPSGSFLMGSPANEVPRVENEGPRRTVTIDHPFAIGVYEVTFAEWDACMAAGYCRGGVDDVGWGRGTLPVINVSWDDVQEFVRWMNSQVGGSPYRLPSEAEWEYAARAGTDTAYWWGNRISPNQANYNGAVGYNDTRSTAYRAQTLPVDSFEGNYFGLYNVHGNVFELVQDCYAFSYADGPTDGSARLGSDCSKRVVRGGSWYGDARSVRSAFRNGYRPADHNRSIGFRLARTLTP